MKYLQQLLEKLKPEETVVLSQLNFSTAEQSVLDYAKSLSGKTLPSTKEACDALGMSSANFRKVSSVVLNKCYETLADHSKEPDLIAYLSDKMLHKAAQHEVVKLLKKYRKSGDDEARKALCYSSVEEFLSASMSDFDDDFVLGLIEEYKSLTGNKENEQVITLRLQLLYMQMVKFSRSPFHREKHFEQQEAFFAKQLNEFEKVLGNAEDPRVIFWLYNGRCEYIEVFVRDIDQSIHFLEKLLALYNLHEGVFPERYKVLSMYKLAMVLYDDSQFDRSFSIFNDIKVNHDKRFYRSVFHVDIYAQLCIVQGKYEDGEHALRKVYRISDDSPWEHQPMWFGPFTVLAMYDLLQDRMEAAWEKIQKANVLCQKSEYFWLDALLRFVENAYFFLMKDYELAGNLVNKNIKFYEYYAKDPDADLFKQCHLIIRALIKQRFEGTPLSDTYEAYYAEWQKGDLAFAGKLLGYLREKVG